MSSRRVLKAAEAIREVVGTSILTELHNPRIRDVTVTFVELSADMRNAKVHVSVMGDEKKQQLSIRGLQNAAGFLQWKVNQRIETRYTPKLMFVLDKGVKNAMEVTRILQEVLPPEPSEIDGDDLDDNDLDDNDLDDNDLDDEDLDDEDLDDNDLDDNDLDDNDLDDNDLDDEDLDDETSPDDLDWPGPSR